MSVGTPVTKVSIVDEFNDRVVSNINRLGAATWYTGNYHLGGTPPAGHIGPQTEPGNKAATDITVNGITPNNIFNILHGWAMEMTRMRFVTSRYYNTHNSRTASYSTASQYTRMSDNYMRYFEIPDGQPDGGIMMDWVELQNFMDKLVLKVNDIRDDAVTLYGCHSSCHSSCHGSRGRR